MWLNVKLYIFYLKQCFNNCYYCLFIILIYGILIFTKGFTKITIISSYFFLFFIFVRFPLTTFIDIVLSNSKITLNTKLLLDRVFINRQYSRTSQYDYIVPNLSIFILRGRRRKMCIFSSALLMLVRVLLCILCNKTGNLW